MSVSDYIISQWEKKGKGMKDYTIHFEKITAWMIIEHKYKTADKAGDSFVSSWPVAAHWEGFDLVEKIDLDEGDKVLSVVPANDDYFVYVSSVSLELYECWAMRLARTKRFQSLTGTDMQWN